MSKENERVRIVDLAIDQQRIAEILAKRADFCSVTCGLKRLRLQRAV